MQGLSRRAFLAGASTALVGCGTSTDGPGRAATSRANVFGSKVRAAPGVARLLPQQESLTQVWAYDGTVPGAGVRVSQGSRLRRTFVNNLPRASTIHWHGIRIENSMDGVPGMTQNPVPPGGEFTYDFAVPDAGTYWYHPHRDSLEQLSRGLTAPLIVTERQPPDVDADITLMINQWRLDASGQIVGYSDAARSLGPIKTPLTVNGQPALTLSSKRNYRLRLRLINGTVGRTLRIAPQGLSGHVMALDGMPLASPQRLSRITLAPAQRTDLIVDVVSEEGDTAYLLGDGGRALVAFQVSGNAGQSPRPAPKALPPNQETPPVLSGSRQVDLRMRGGARRWTLNGVSGMPGDPLIEAARGETVIVRMFNENGAPHAMHLHGHHFREVRGTRLGPLRDTILMAPNQQMSVAFVADNPGDWMFHCHMLEHMAAGMMTWIKVLG